MTIVAIALLVLAGIVILASFLPFIPTHAGLVRICDFPRPQILIMGVIALAGVVAVLDWQSWLAWTVGVLLVIAIAVQALRILPYMPFIPEQTTAPGEKTAAVSLLVSNVQISNRDASKLIEAMNEYDPDIVLLVEVDDWWEEQLRPIAERYPHVTSLPQDDGYGLVFMTRLPIESCEVLRRVRSQIPSVKAKLRLDSGNTFWFYGVHPEPPGPIQDAEDRDAELLIVAKEMRDDGHASIVAGDLNDVAWSRTTRSFQRIAEALDPRRGRGLYASFHADYWFARWPLDHLFHTSDFATDELKVLPHIGSDHFPVFARLRFIAEKQER
jgi:endonuclease/exonuclease/phosphatase (EEP) superfamily protein YafD